jgi:hypothetical protein
MEAHHNLRRQVEAKRVVFKEVVLNKPPLPPKNMKGLLQLQMTIRKNSILCKQEIND